MELLLGGDITDAAWEQCSLGVRSGGLGLRTARQTALASFLASRIASRPHVVEMATHMQKAGLCDAEVVVKAYDARTEDARRAAATQ